MRSLLSSRRLRSLLLLLLLAALALPGLLFLLRSPSLLTRDVEMAVQEFSGSATFPSQRPFVSDTSLSPKLYTQFATPPPLRRPSAEDAVVPVPMLEGRCRSTWVARGILEEGCEAEGSPRQVDFIWTWLNGSDPRWHELSLRFSHLNETGSRQAPPARHYRDHGELQHSLRSVVAALPFNGSESGLHVLLGDWAEERKQVGQRPAWLRDDRGVNLVWHSQVWQDWTEYGALPEEERWEGRKKLLGESLPTFNSFSIEANLVNLNTSATSAVYMNDDFFLVTPHSSSDFYTPLYGPVIPLSVSSPSAAPPVHSMYSPEHWNLWRVDDGMVGANPNGALSCNHEWEALKRSNWLIGKRFGLRPRPIAQHIPKPLVLPLLHELTAICGPSSFARSVKRRFREDARRRPGDYHTVWMAQAFVLERAREGMLWSWAVGKMGAEGVERGVWGQKEREVLRVMWRVDETELELQAAQDRQPLTIWQSVFGRPRAALKHVVVPQTTSEQRHTLRPDLIGRSLAQLGHSEPQANIYGWSSFDGPPPPFGATMASCKIHLESCFGSFWKSPSPRTPAVDIFRRLAFEKPFCGDCILSSLVQHSGKLGLDILLPSRGAVVRLPSRARPSKGQAHLPLTAEWKDTDFSIDAVLERGGWGGEVNLREWCEELIARYPWTVVGNSTASFVMVTGPTSLDDVISRVASAHPPSSLGLNDDIPGGFSEIAITKARETSDKLRGWLEARWGQKAAWEV